MSDDLRKVIARLRTATLPKLDDVYLVCDALEKLLTTNALVNTAAVNTEPVNKPDHV
jgi:hypothetical protein